MKLEFNIQARNNLKAVETCGAIKKDKCVLLGLPDLGKLEAQSTSLISDKFTLVIQSESKTNSQTHTA